MSLVAKNLTVERLGRVVLRDVSLRLADGECVSVIGPNGAGKSSLMLSLIGLLRLSAGWIELGEQPLARLSRRQIAQRVAYVPQMHDGYLGFPARDVVESARYAHLAPLEALGAEDHRAVDAAIAATHIKPLLDRPIDTLSGGERQKVWIAAALAQDSPMLFLDEPTNALDPAHQAELIRIMQNAVRNGRTLLVICHDLNLPLALGGRVVAMKSGQVLFDEPVDALHETDRLAQLFDTSFELHHDDARRQFSIQLNHRQDA